MKFEFPKIIRELDLSGYDPAFAGRSIQVWVNPPRSLLDAHNASINELREVVRKASEAVLSKDLTDEERLAQKEATAREIERLGKAQIAFYAEIWGQGSDPMTPEDVEAMIAVSAETDPAFFDWIKSETIGMIRAHRDGIKKG